MSISHYTNEAIDLLASMIATPSGSREENDVATLIFDWMQKRELKPSRLKNNIFAWASKYDDGKPSVMLNSHIDTVRAGEGWTHDPHLPTIQQGKLFGLGSNDAGASVVSMLAAFRACAKETLPYNLCMAITAEEEISGTNGIELLLPQLPTFDFVIVGEPTEMKAALAERGLLVLDVEVQGKTGHAARNEGENAIYKALKDIHWFETFAFPQSSELLGDLRMTVTEIHAGTQHNVVPDRCRFVVDIRLNDTYTHEKVLAIINNNITGKATPRSTRLKPSKLARNHGVRNYLQQLGIETFGSATMSDQALIAYPSMKMGPGRSERSHTPDEFIFLEEIQDGVERYVSFLNGLELSMLRLT